MKKRIGVFIGEIAQEYQQVIVKNISKRANSLGYDTVFICSYGSYNEDILYAEGEKACVHLPDCDSFDGIIVTEDVFDIDGMPDELYNIIMETAHCPVVYLRSTRENCYSILTENTSSIESMTNHFIEEHGFTDICYMSGKKDAEDAKERLSGFLAAMKKHNLPVNETMIFHGDYWRYKGKEAVDWFMQNRTNYPQAIVCANDYMALSICEELRKRGLKVPQDVCVSGFDLVDEARVNSPTLTSLEIDFEAMANKAVDIIDSVNNGNKEERIHRVPAHISLNKSCGCGEQYRYKKGFKFLEAWQHQVTDTKNTLLSTIDYQDSFEFDEYMDVADKYRRFIRADKAYFCFCDTDESGYDEVENDSDFTESMILRRIFTDQSATKKLYLSFPRNKLLPDEFWSEDEPNNFCIFTMHFKNIVYGYMVAEIPSDGWFDIFTQGYLMMLSNAIQNGEVQRQMQQLEAIRAVYQKDSLTGILNRRGFDKLLQDKYAMYKKKGTNFALFSIDMDNLKVINDTYGHAKGDEALQTVAKALSSVMKEGDFCARVGGDEFSAVINVSYQGRCQEFKNELNMELKRESAGILDYNVEASVGFCDISEQPGTTLVSCVQIADARMYEEKRSKKGRIAHMR